MLAGIADAFFVSGISAHALPLIFRNLTKVVIYRMRVVLQTNHTEIRINFPGDLLVFS